MDTNIFEELKDLLTEFKTFLDQNVPTIRPAIVVVTGEPTPSRLASLALGTGDLDMVYHFALPELIEGVAASGNDEAISMLGHLIEGKRLRDISDLPLDLAI